MQVLPLLGGIRLNAFGGMDAQSLAWTLRHLEVIPQETQGLWAAEGGRQSTPFPRQQTPKVWTPDTLPELPQYRWKWSLVRSQRSGLGTLQGGKGVGK